MRRLGVGLMSGTSLDGIDCAIASIEGYNEHTKVVLHYFETYPLDPLLVERIQCAMDPKKSSSDLLCSLNFELGYAFADAVKTLCKDSKIELSSLDFVASHGQTIYHMPFEDQPHHRSTMQLGEGAVIKESLNVTVVNNFRAADMAVGGQGAPLVPFADYILFKDETKTRVLHNIGGISNLTILKKGCQTKDVIAFDTGPGNMMINDAMHMLFDQPFDDQGKIASKGKSIPSMMNELLDDPYFLMPAPKSTGREHFGIAYTKHMIEKYKTEKPEDIVATFTQFTAKTMADAYQTHILPYQDVDEIIVSGGGVHNTYLMSLFKDLLHPISINTIEKYGMNSDAKEALAFLILGHHTLGGIPNHIPSTTGATKQVILGQINPIIIGSGGPL